MKDKKLSKEEINDLKNGLKVLGLVIAFFVFVYVVTTIITGEALFFSGKVEEEVPRYTRIQYDEILAGEVFERPEEEYYVIFFDGNSRYSSFVDYAMHLNNEEEEPRRLYIVDLSLKFNSFLLDEEEMNLDTLNINDLRSGKIGMIKIANRENVFQIDNLDDLEKYFE